VPAAAPASLRTIAERVEARIEEFLRVESERWSALDNDLTEPMGEIARLAATPTIRSSPMPAQPSNSCTRSRSSTTM
jgi:geranylgeranyl diphosphate synthase type I